MESIEENIPEIKIPFIPLSFAAGSSKICVVGSRPNCGRVLFALQLIEENSIKQDFECLAYFVSKDKPKLITQLGFLNKLESNKNINLQWTGYGGQDNFIRDLKKELLLNDWPDYIIIAGFENLFYTYINGNQICNEAEKLLSDLRIICDQKRITIIITTHLLFQAELRTAPVKPILSDFGSNQIEILADHILVLNNPLQYADAEDQNTKALQITQLKPWIFNLPPVKLLFSKEENRFYP